MLLHPGSDLHQLCRSKNLQILKAQTIAISMATGLTLIVWLQLLNDIDQRSSKSIKPASTLSVSVSVTCWIPKGQKQGCESYL